MTKALNEYYLMLVFTQENQTFISEANGGGSKLMVKNVTRDPLKWGFLRDPY